MFLKNFWEMLLGVLKGLLGGIWWLLKAATGWMIVTLLLLAVIYVIAGIIPLWVIPIIVLIVIAVKAWQKSR